MKMVEFTQNNIMSFIKVTDGQYSGSNMFYIYNQLSPLVNRLGGKAELDCQNKRCAMEIIIDKSYAGFVRSELEDKIADVIAVNYKYEFFKGNINTKGLSPLKYELLLSALICADLEDDKRYVSAKMSRFDEYSVDGSFNFRMKPLKKKWEEIVSIIPLYFQDEQLKDFITFILREKKGKKVYVENERVYDKNFNRLQRTLLTDLNLQEGKIIREVILSGSGEVELHDKPPKLDEFYLKEYFGDKIAFGKGFFDKKG